MVADKVKALVSDEEAVRFSNNEKSLKALSAVWNSLSALLSWPRAENLVVVLFSRRASCASLGAFSALTIALTMLSISIPEPTPVIPTMLNTSSLC